MMTRADAGQPSPRLSILKILKRRKKTLKEWAVELNVNTLAAAEHWCNRMGVAPPTKQEWTDLIGDPTAPPLVNDPTDGIVIITTDDLVNEKFPVDEPEPDTISDSDTEDDEDEKPQRRKRSYKKKRQDQESE